VSEDAPSTPAAQLAYEGYAASTGGLTFDGRPMPTWAELPERIQNAWTAAVRAAVNAVGAEVQPHIDEVIRHGNRMTGAALVQHQDVVVEGATAIDRHCEEIVRLLEPA
jgi:hypothetical protein